MTQTPLDAAHAAMMADLDSDALRRAYWSRLLGSELHILLAAEPGPAAVPEPRIEPLSDGPIALAFDSEERLGAFLETPAPTAALSGRRLVALLAGRGVGIGLNLGVADSAILLPSDAVEWAAAHLAPLQPQAILAEVQKIGPPDATPTLIASLDARIAALAGQCAEVWLARLTHGDGSATQALAIVGMSVEARPAAVEALGEAHRLEGGGGPLDMLFLVADDPALAAFRRNGLGFDLPQRPAAPARALPGAPGLDPNRPPRLR
ncbi:MAG: SseB family protein [Pseudomonadota bacterium]